MAPIVPIAQAFGLAGSSSVGQRQAGAPRVPQATSVTGAGSSSYQARPKPGGFPGGYHYQRSSRARSRGGYHQRQDSFSTAASRSAGVAAGPSAGELRAGCLALFTKNDKLLLGLVAEPDGKRNWWMVDQNGHRSSVQPKAAQLVLPGWPYTAADLERFSAAGRELLDMSLLEIAWSIAAEAPGSTLSLEELAALLYDDAGPLSLYSTYVMLQADSLYFQQASKAPPSYRAKSEDVVAQLRQQQEEQEARKQAEQAFVTAAGTALKAAKKSGAQQWLQGPHAERIAALQEFALKQAQCSASADRLARESLSLLHLAPTHQVAYALLVDLGLYRRHEPVGLLRAGISLDFPAELEQAAASLLASPPSDPDAPRRADLSHLATFTIDDEGTTEVDDGVSVEVLGDGALQVWVHIADPTRWVRPGEALDLEGRRRTRTLYLPWGALPMFPRALAEGPFSLNAGAEPREALSISVVLAPDGRVAEYKVQPSSVLVTHKLTYDQVDDMLAQPAHCPHEQLLLLQRAAELRTSWRKARDSVDILLPEADVEVAAGDMDSALPRVTITSRQDGPARRLVQEMMVLAGEVIGRLGEEQDIPLPYRGQDPPALPDPTVLAALPSEEARAFALKRCMTRSSSSSTPVAHASLGLPAYVQFTSPIRRYSDVIAHWQVKAWLRGADLPFSRRDIDAIMTSVSEVGRDLNRLEGEVTRYWVAEYFRQHQASSWRAQVLGYVKEEMLLAAVLLEDIGLETVVRLDTPVAAGQHVELQVSQVNVADGFYRLVSVGVYGDEAEAEEGEVQEGEEQEGEASRE